MEKLIDYIVRLITSTGPWLSKKWLYVLPIVGILIAMLLFTFNLIPTIPEQTNKVTFQYWKIGSLIGAPIILILIWIISTQLYLRTGSGAKIGFAYDGYKVDISDWKRTKVILSDLFKKEQLKNRVSLRFVPLRATEIDTVGKVFMKRYRFTILASLEQSIAPNKPTPVNSFHIRINTTKDTTAFLQKTLQDSLAIHAGRSQKGRSVADVLKNQALNLHDMLLLFVATHNYATGSYEDASVLLRHIDNSLAIDFNPLKPPRFNIREFDVLSCIAPLRFSVKDSPLPDDLEKRILLAEKAMIYFDDFAAVYTAISRAKFLLAKNEEAYSLTDRFHLRIKELQNQGMTINQDVLSTSFLNAGFLYFIRESWKDSYDNYSSLLKMPQQKESWDELVEFIDYVADLEQYEGIVFLQMMYRKIAGQKVTSFMTTSVHKWIEADESRKILLHLLNEIPILPSAKKHKNQRRY